MTSYCDVANPTRHLEPMLESCKVGNYSWRMYDEVVNSARDGVVSAQEKQMTAPAPAGVQSAMLQYGARGAAVTTMTMQERNKSQMTVVDASQK